MPNDCFIYGLSDPRTGEVRYIGKTVHGMSRPRKHGSAYILRHNRTHRTNWIKKLASEGVTFDIKVLEVCTPETVLDRERAWIYWAKQWGWNLTNHTDGGEGIPGYRFTEAQSQRLSVAMTGKKKSPEARANISANQHRKRPIIDTTTGIVYASVSDARDTLGLNLACICRVLDGKQRQTKGHVFLDAAFFNA